MHIIQVSTEPDEQSPHLRDYTSLTDVALRTALEPERGLYIAEGATVIRRAIAAGHQPRSLLMAPKWLPDLKPDLEVFEDVPVFLAEEDMLQTVTGFHLHRGALAAMRRPLLPPVGELLAESSRIAVIEDVIDHTNVGAIFRSAAALGIDAVLITPRCADPLYRRSIRVSMGTVFQVPWSRFDYWPTAAHVSLPKRKRERGIGPEIEGQHGVDLLRQHGFTVVAMALSPQSVSLDDFAGSLPDKFAIVLGTEGDGLRASTLAECDVQVQIPMAGQVDSLNVAAAAAVAFWATCR